MRKASGSQCRGAPPLEHRASSRVALVSGHLLLNLIHHESRRLEFNCIPVPLWR